MISVTITNGGSGYVSPPAVVFTGGGGSGATGVATLGPCPSPPTPTATSTATSTRTPTRTPAPAGGACTESAQCQAGLFCIDNVCSRPSAPAPAMSSAGLLAGVTILTAIGALALLRRRVGSRH